MVERIKMENFAVKELSGLVVEERRSLIEIRNIGKRTEPYGNQNLIIP